VPLKFVAVRAKSTTDLSAATNVPFFESATDKAFAQVYAL
jgi:hypothetical protein